MTRMPDSSKPLPFPWVWLLSPLILLLIPVLRKHPTRGWLAAAVLLPVIIAGVMVFFLPAEKPVYREISLIKGLFNNPVGDLWIRAGLTGHKGGVFPLQLLEDCIALPNRDEGLTLSSNPAEVQLVRQRWESREFFISAPSEIPVKTEISRTGTVVSGFLSWGPGGDFRSAILIGGEFSAEKEVLLFEPGGPVFQSHTFTERGIS